MLYYDIHFISVVFEPAISSRYTCTDFFLSRQSTCLNSNSKLFLLHRQVAIKNLWWVILALTWVPEVFPIYVLITGQLKILAAYMQNSEPHFCGYLYSLIGEGNCNPLQYSCLENSMDGEAWLGYDLWSHKESDTTEQQALYCIPFLIWSHHPKCCPLIPHK